MGQWTLLLILVNIPFHIHVTSYRLLSFMKTNCVLGLELEDTQGADAGPVPP
jgi:hypothetical protein